MHQAISLCINPSTGIVYGTHQWITNHIHFKHSEYTNATMFTDCSLPQRCHLKPIRWGYTSKAVLLCCPQGLYVLFALIRIGEPILSLSLGRLLAKSKNGMRPCHAMGNLFVSWGGQIESYWARGSGGWGKDQAVPLKGAQPSRVSTGQRKWGWNLQVGSCKPLSYLSAFKTSA